MAKPSQNKGKIKPISALILLTGSVLYLSLQFFYGFDFLACESFSSFLQGSGSPTTLTPIMKGLSFAMSRMLEFVIVAFIALDPIKIRSIKVLILYMTAEAVTQYLKILYRKPRPYFVFADIQPLVCNTNYGNPSGHAVKSAFTFAILYYVYLYCDSAKYTTNIPYENISGTTEEITPLRDPEKQTEKGCHTELHKLGEESRLLVWLRESNCLKFMLAFLMVVFCVISGISRIYLGAHTVGQILAGWSYACILFLFFVYVAEMAIDTYLANLCFKTLSSRNIQYILRVILPLIIIIIPVALYEVLRRDGSVIAEQNAWEQAIVEKCGGGEGIYQKSPLDHCFEELAVPIIIEVILFGLLLSPHYRDGYFRDNLQNLKYIQLIGRVLLYLGIYIGISKLFDLVPKLKTEVADTYFAFFVKGYIPFVLQGLAISLLVPLLFKPLRLLPTQKKQDYFPSEEQVDEKIIL